MCIRDRDCAEIVDCEPGANERRSIRQPSDYAIASTHTKRLQRRRLRAHLLATFAPGPLRAIFEQCEPSLRNARRAIVEDRLEHAILTTRHARIEPRRMHGPRSRHWRLSGVRFGPELPSRNPLGVEADRHAPR